MPATGGWILCTLQRAGLVGWTAGLGTDRRAEANPFQGGWLRLILGTVASTLFVCFSFWIFPLGIQGARPRGTRDGSVTSPLLWNLGPFFLVWLRCSLVSGFRGERSVRRCHCHGEVASYYVYGLRVGRFAQMERSHLTFTILDCCERVERIVTKPKSESKFKCPYAKVACHHRFMINLDTKKGP